MSWALARRLIIIVIIVVVIGSLVGAIAFFILHKPASCVDGTQNRDETGIDCGGQFCMYLCATDVVPLSVSFARALPSGGGRVDLIAFVSNANSSSALSAAPYTFQVYSADRTIIASVKGTIDIPAASTVPVFIANVAAGSATPQSAFLSFDTASLKWFRAMAPRAVPQAQNVQVTGSSSPRIDATLTNPLAVSFVRLPVVATVFDAAGNALDASGTLVPELPPQGSAPLVFTWNAPFGAAPARIEIRAVLPVPAPPAH
jgi:hypothetical protein